MAWDAAFVATAGWAKPEQIETFRRNLDPAWIEAALAASGTATVRRRRLPVEEVVWIVLGMALFRDRPMEDIVSKLDLALPSNGDTVARSSVVQARQRLGSEPMKWLFERSALAWAHASADAHRWRGLALYGIDGSTLRVPDTSENRAHFGGQAGRTGSESGYPDGARRRADGTAVALARGRVDRDRTAGRTSSRARRSSKRRCRATR